MSNYDKVIKAMETDPKRIWTAPEIAELVEPERCSKQTFRSNRIFKILVVAEKYGQVRKLEGRPNKWVLI